MVGKRFKTVWSTCSLSKKDKGIMQKNQKVKNDRTNEDLSKGESAHRESLPKSIQARKRGKTSKK